jgi:hypothetical protein
MLGRRQRMHLECNNGIRDRDLNVKLRLKERTSGRIFRKTAKLKTAKQIG